MGILSAFRFAFQNLFFTPILYGVIASLAVFSTVWDRGDRLKDQLTDGFRSQHDTFDFIIVGGGSAGAVLANRLSQFHTVLLLEAGGETHPFQAIPGLSIFIPKNPGTDWSHKSIAQTRSCLACRHKKYIFSQGRNLGGSGNINYMMHLRGNPLDFNNWATITSDPSWGYEGVLPYFIQSEHFVGETTDKTAHGYGGPLQIQIPDCIGLAKEWNLAGAEMGYPHVDLNGRHSEGFDTVFYPIKHGVRQATYRAYIQPVRNRHSLLIRKFAHVNKVLIKEGTNEAHGVVYDRHGHSKHAFANKEVILSAGTLQTPKLLVLSGVGQLEHLQALHIPVRSVLPVGKNLQDHFSTLLGPFYINKARTVSFDRDIDKQSFIRFASSGKGPLSTTGFQATAMLTSSIATSQGQGGWPDIQLTLFGLTPHRMFYSDIGHAFGIREDILHRYYGDATGKENAFFIMVTLARPVSKGDFCVPRNDPYKPPVIDPNYLMDPEGQDVRVMIEGIHRALFLAENTTVFRGLETVYSPKCFPGCEKVPFRSDAYWDCYVRSYSIAMNDHVGTCPMGKIGSPYAVVDPELQVQGIKGLRVVDASVMPTIVGAPTQAATIMIAEKASALILDKWKHDSKTFYGPPGRRPGPPLTQYGPPKNPGTQYGPPGSTPGTPVQQYGPPGNTPGTPVQQYGPPAIPGNQYGPPGAGSVSVGPGDGFSNYDSFSLIKDQLNPNTGNVGGTPRPTPLIPLPQDPQVWSTPEPFPNSVSSNTPFISGIGSTPAPLAPEPLQVLVPPEQFTQSPGPTYATSFATSNIDFTGSIISSTPDYAASFNVDTARSSSDNTDRADTPSTENENNATSTGRQGKSFGDVVVPDVPDGNQLGQGIEDKDLILPNTTPTSIPTFAPTESTTTSSGQFVTVSEVVNQGSGYRIIRKRIRTTPRVVVHPRGHLGHQNVQRRQKMKLNESLEMLFLTTSSVRPVPKNVVKIRRRRPVPFRRRTTTTTIPPTTAETVPGDDADSETIAYSDVVFDYTTTTIPPTEIPELQSPGRKRFVRRMFARPLNFNGKNKRWTRGHNDHSAQATTGSAVVVTIPPNVTEIIATTTKSPVVQEEEEEDQSPDQPDDLEGTTEYPTFLDDNLTKEDPLEDENSSVPPVVVFKNIELEDTEELTRNARSSSTNSTSIKSDYFKYTVEPEDENKNPIMVVDLNPVPEIIAPKALMEEPGTEREHETIAIDLSENAELGQEDKQDFESTTVSNEYYYEEEDHNPLSSYEVVSDHSESIKGAENNSSTINDSSTVSQLVNSSINSSSDKTSNIKVSVVVSSSSSTNFSINNSSNKSISSKKDNLTTFTTTTSTTTPPEIKLDEYEGATEAISTSTPSSSTLQSVKRNPRYNFRMRNKLIRLHS